ncbi:C6 zinc finger domain-containing protein [Apiospora phragmitis]|uniref:C6 zinc finger domain-containing protein n=1 Tax=Apiospora phragmitis TaxID=2905665 RepID=A0ABR1SR34_9PEZI
MAFEPFHQRSWAKIREVNSHTFLNGLPDFKQHISHPLIRIWSLDRPRPNDLVSQLSVRRTGSNFLNLNQPILLHRTLLALIISNYLHRSTSRLLLTIIHFSRPGELPHNPVQAQLDERRYHEPDRFAPPPIQDHHRHPPRQRISRHQDMTLPQLRRPNSTGNAPDGLPPTPHQMPHPNHQQDDHRRPPSFDNGPQYPQSPAMYRPPGAYTPAPPTPVQLPGHYEPQNHGYGYHAPSPEVAYPAPVAIATKRKAQRASQACDSCRQLKAKCDELKPCKNCKEKGIQCNYREPPAKQPDKVSADILEILQSLKAQTTSIDERMSRMDSRVNSNLKRMDKKIDRALTNGGSLENVKMESVEDNHDLAQSPGDNDSQDELEGGEDEIQSDRETNGEPAMTKEAADQVFQQANEIEIEQEPEPPVDPGKPSMPANHTTLAGLLLKWPSIAKLVESTLQTEKIQHVNEFPIRQEQQRGLLRVHGKGEGTDMEVKNVLKEPHYNDLMTDVNDMDGQGSDAPTPPPGENWGQCAPLNDPNLSLYKGGPLNVDGTPELDHSKVRKDEEKQATSAPPSAKFVGAGSELSAGIKRKRSLAMGTIAYPALNSGQQLEDKQDELKLCKEFEEKAIQCNYQEPPAK